MSKRTNGYSRHLKEIDIQAGMRLRQRRLLLGMSQQQLADRAGIAFQQIQKYEFATDRMAASRLAQLAQILNVPIDYFFKPAPELAATGGGNDGGKPATGVAAETNELLQRRETLELIRAYYRIKDKPLRKLVCHIARRVSELEG
jgi:transcriptional regulator with XRE-family HTH domain